MLPDPGIAHVAASRGAMLMGVATGRSATLARRQTAGKKWHAEAYKDIFGLKPVDAPLVLAEELITYRDHGQGSHKRARYQKMRQIMNARFTETIPSEGVFIRRGGAGLARTILNEDEICDQLAARGWTILNIADVSVEELYAHIHGTKVVVGLDGSQLSHAVLMLPDDGSLVLLTPPDRFTAVIIDHCRGARLGSGFVLLEGADGQYRADLDAILATVDIARAQQQG